MWVILLPVAKSAEIEPRSSGRRQSLHSLNGLQLQFVFETLSVLNFPDYNCNFHKYDIAEVNWTSSWQHWEHNRHWLRMFS
jgi:hypothetical protein